MRFLSILANVSSFYHNVNRYTCNNNNNGNRLLHTVKSFGGIGGPDEVFKLVPVSKEEAEKTPSSNLISYDYIKKLEAENHLLTEQLKQNCKLIKSLNDDMSQMQSDRLYCMIFETYQRFRLQIGINHDDSGKIDVFLEAVKKGKFFTDDKLVHWMINFESSEPGQLLKEFRNQYSHYTCNDVNVLRQWRSKLIEDSYENCTMDRKNLNDAAVNILNVVIDHLNHPQSRPLLRKNLKDSKLKGIEFNTTKLINKMERKRNDVKGQTKQVSQEKLNVYDVFQVNSAKIARLRKSLRLGDSGVYGEIRRLQTENRNLYKRYGHWITKKKRRD